MFLLYQENTALIVELTNLRQRRAKLLGFDSHVSYVVDNCMAKHTELILRFLTKLTGETVVCRYILHLKFLCDSSSP